MRWLWAGVARVRNLLTLSLTSLAVVLTALVATQSPAQAQVPGPFVQTSGSHLMLDGHPWYLYGGSTYHTSNPGGPQSVHDEIDLALAGGLNTLRIVNMFDERGIDPDAPFDESAWQHVDQLLAAMQAAELHAILDLSAFRNHLQNRELSVRGQSAIADSYPIPTSCPSTPSDAQDRCVGADWCAANPGVCIDPYSTDQAGAWSSFLSWVATRTNTVTGVQYRDDPTIAIVSFAGEPNPPNSQEPLRPGTQELTDFYGRVFGDWKSVDNNHLVTSGGLLHIDWEALYGSSSGIDHQAIWALGNEDVLSIHNYFAQFPATPANDTKTSIIATAAQTLGKPWITEEFGFPQKPSDNDTTYTEADRADWFQSIYDTQLNPAQGVPSAGVAFWNLGPEVAGGSHDVNPTTPATWGVVVANAPGSVVAISDGGLLPRSVSVPMGKRVQWTFSSTKLHTVTDSASLGPNRGPLFDSGPRTSGSYAYRFTASGTYAYRSTSKKDGTSFNGTVAVPMIVTPTTGHPSSSFTLTMASQATGGYRFDIQVRYRKPGSSKWGSWSTLSSTTATSSTFVPTKGAGTYAFHARLANVATGRASGWSPDGVATVTP